MEKRFEKDDAQFVWLFPRKKSIAKKLSNFRPGHSDIK